MIRKRHGMAYDRPMKKSATLFLQAAMVLIGIGVLALMLWEPHLEGRNAHATLFEIYFKDPFLAYAYGASISFFVALHQAYQWLGYVGKNKASSVGAVRALRTIKRCAMYLVGSIAAAEAYLCIVQRGKEDMAGGVAVGLFLIFASAVMGITAALFERAIQSAQDIKSKNAKTVGKKGQKKKKKR